MAKAQIDLMAVGGGVTFDDIGNVLTTNGFTAGTKSTTSFTAIVGKTYMFIETRGTSYANPGIDSGGVELGGTVFTDSANNQNVYIGIVKATSTTIKGLGTNNYNWYCQLD